MRRWSRPRRPGWNPVASSTAPTTRRGSVRSAYGRPPMSAAPVVGRTSPSTIRSVVDLPAPFGPRKPVTRPAGTSNVRSRTATTGPNRLPSPRTSIVTATPLPVRPGAVVTRSRHLRPTAGAVSPLPQRRDVRPLAGPYRDGMTRWDRLRAWAREPLVMDVALAAVVVTVTLVTTTAGPQGGRLDALALAAATVAGGVLVVRRLHPFATLVVSAVAAEVYLVHFHGHHGTLVLAAPLVALCTLAELSTRRRALIVACLVILVFGAVHVWVKPASWLGADNLALAAFGGLAVAAGTASRHRRAYLAEVQARAEQAEADREAEAIRRVTEERLRIARDLH